LREREDIPCSFSFLEYLGYPGKEFVVWPEGALHRRKDHSVE
jgi:hypothetical protein